MINTVTISLQHVKPNELLPITHLFDFITKDDKLDAIKQMANILSPMTASKLSNDIAYRGVNCVYHKGNRYFVVVKFKGEFVNKELIIGHESSFDGKYHEFPIWAALLMREGDDNMYFAILHESCCPNWNGEADVLKLTPLIEINVPVISSINGIDKIDCNILKLMHRSISPDYKDILDIEGSCKVYIEDDKTGYCLCVNGNTLNDVFTEIANKYQGWRNYRDTNASEYVIMNKETNEMFQKWKQTANCLISSFDKFYRGGIVD